MSEAKHTPGPWKVEYGHRSNYPHQIVSTTIKDRMGRSQIITTWGAIAIKSSDEGQANARLIASAPDLMDAIEQALDDMRGDGLFVCQATKDQLRAAIAKATGA